MNAELKPVIDKIVTVLKAECGREVYLFGSQVRGTTRADSDIDIAVSGLPPERFFYAMGKLYGVVDRAFDLIDLDEESPFTHYLKTQEGELLRVG